nr:MetQ/NlpA family ABC transporter substrate-binding protein [Desulforamulus aquiferis]
MLFAGGCGQESTKLKVGMLPIADNLPFWVAEQKGYFKEEGIEVELIAFPSALERDSAFTAKQIDAGIGDLIAVATMNNAGTKVKSVAVAQGISPGENRFAILAAPNSDIKSVEQLKNVPIAMSLNTINEYITDRMLTEKGLSQEDIKKIAVPKLPVRFDALMGGTVMAATLPDPMATLAEIGGAHLIADNSKNTLAQTVVIVRQETLDKNDIDIEKLMKAYSRAVSDIQRNPDQFNDILMEEAKIPKNLLSSGNQLRFIYSAPELPKEEDVDAVIEWMLEHDLLKNKLTYGDMVYGKVL